MVLTGKDRNNGKNHSHCHSVHHTVHVDCPGNPHLSCSLTANCKNFNVRLLRRTWIDKVDVSNLNWREFNRHREGRDLVATSQ
jgi:hypothetical protein